jgi:hypothetical protein
MIAGQKRRYSPPMTRDHDIATSGARAHYGVSDVFGRLTREGTNRPYRACSGTSVHLQELKLPGLRRKWPGYAETYVLI